MLKDYNLKNTKVVLFILEYSIVFSCAIIIIGFLIIFSSFDRTISTEISIYPSLSTRAYVQYYDNSTLVSNYFNPKNEFRYGFLPFESIKLNLDYNEPLSCGGSFKIKGIKIDFDHDVVKDINLSLSLHGQEGIASHYYFDAKQSSKENVTSVFKTSTFNQYNGNLILSGQKSYDNFDFYFLLNYSDFEGRSTYFNGRVDPEPFIRCMDYVTETNVSISKFLLRLTGVMIILGSFPFVASLRQILLKEKR